MSQRLFNVPKVGLFLDGYAASQEKRKKAGLVKIITLTLRCDPFDAKLAAAVDDGLGNPGVRAALFKLNHPDPKPHLTRVNFNLGAPRQLLEVYSAPDTAASRIAFPHCKITDTYARSEKGRNGFVFVFKAVYGPVGATELEYIHEWWLSQRFITFNEAEAGFEFDEPVEGEEEAGEPSGEEQPGLAPGVPAPMWTDASEDTAARRVPKRGTKKTPGARTNPDAERDQQKADGAKRARKTPHTAPRSRAVN